MYKIANYIKTSGHSYDFRSSSINNAIQKVNTLFIKNVENDLTRSYATIENLKKQEKQIKSDLRFQNELISYRKSVIKVGQDLVKLYKDLDGFVKKHNIDAHSDLGRDSLWIHFTSKEYGGKMTAGQVKDLKKIIPKGADIAIENNGERLTLQMLNLPI